MHMLILDGLYQAVQMCENSANTPRAGAFMGWEPYWDATVFVAVC